MMEQIRKINQANQDKMIKGEQTGERITERKMIIAAR